MDDHPMLINFLNDHYGMFVHWGLFSVAAGVWKGQAQEPRSLGEAVMLDFRIPLAEYRKLADASMVTLPGPHIEDERCSVCVEADGQDGFCQTISTPKLRESYRYRLSEKTKRIFGWCRPAEP
jgi:hypothetical protein